MSLEIRKPERKISQQEIEKMALDDLVTEELLKEAERLGRVWEFTRPSLNNPKLEALRAGIEVFKLE